MTRQLWMNLPVKDTSQSMEFFNQLGFKANRPPGNIDQVQVVVGEHNFNIMLFPKETFEKFTNHEVVDTRLATEVLFSVGAVSKEEVDEIARKVVEAGGTLFHEPEDSQGWMYGCGFCDLDGHRWNVLYMNQDEMPKA
ncbi:VOC family protein [Sporosarcina sp. CAU 1771]